MLSPTSITTIIDDLELLDVELIRSGVDSLDSLLRLLVSPVELWRTTKIMPPTLATFTSLQQTPNLNIASAMVNTYAFLELHPDEELLLQANGLLQGLLLVHANSRLVFAKKRNMVLMLRFLEHGDFNVAILFITLFIHILLNNMANFRVFEANGGCNIIIKKLKLDSLTIDRNEEPRPVPHQLNQRDLNFKIIEFLIFYFIDETSIRDADVPVKTVREKADLFRADFDAIDTLIENLNELKNE